MTESRARFGLGLAALTGLGLAVRLAYVLGFRAGLGLIADAGYYHGLANLLVTKHRFIQPGFALLFHHEQSASHPPLYACWLALASLVFGGHASQTTHLVWSTVLGAGSVVLCGLAGREVGGARVGLLAAGLAAVYPNLWYHDGTLFSETAAIFTSAGVILFAYRLWRRPGVGRAVALGMWCGLAALSRSELVLTWPLVLLPLVLRLRDVTWRDRARWLVASLVTMVVVLLPWTLYNLRRFREPVYLSTQLGETLVATNCDATFYGRWIGFQDFDCLAQGIITAQRTNRGWRRFDQSQKDRALRRVARAYVSAHEARVPVVALARTGRTLGVFRPFQELSYDRVVERQEHWMGDTLVLTYWAVASLAVAGVVVMRHRKLPLWPPLGMVLIVVVASAVTYGQSRFRAPAEPGLVLLAAVALDRVPSIVRRRARVAPVEVSRSASGSAARWSPRRPPDPRRC